MTATDFLSDHESFAEHAARPVDHHQLRRSAAKRGAELVIGPGPDHAGHEERRLPLPLRNTSFGRGSAQGAVELVAHRFVRPPLFRRRKRQKHHQTRNERSRKNRARHSPLAFSKLSRAYLSRPQPRCNSNFAPPRKNQVLTKPAKRNRIDEEQQRSRNKLIVPVPSKCSR